MSRPACPLPRKPEEGVFKAGGGGWCGVWQEVEEAPRRIGEDGKEFPGGGGWGGWRAGSKMEE